MVNMLQLLAGCCDVPVKSGPYSSCCLSSSRDLLAALLLQQR